MVSIPFFAYTFYDTIFNAESGRNVFNKKSSYSVRNTDDKLNLISKKLDEKARD